MINISIHKTYKKIIDMYKQGIAIKDIAILFGYSKGHVYNIVRLSETKKLKTGGSHETK